MAVFSPMEADLGPILGRSWAQEAPSWAHFGPPLGHQAQFLRFKSEVEAIKPKMLKIAILHQFFKVFATSKASLAELRGPLGDVLGRSWRILKACQVPSRVTETYLERSETTS